MSDSKRRGGGPPDDHDPATCSDAIASSAADVAATLRARLPNLPIKKLHKLLYYFQGPHLARFDRTREPGGRVRIEREWMPDYFSADAGNDELFDPPAEVMERWRAVVQADVEHDVRSDSVEEIRGRLGRSA